MALARKTGAFTFFHFSTILLRELGGCFDTWIMQPSYSVQKAFERVGGADGSCWCEGWFGVWKGGGDGGESYMMNLNGRERITYFTLLLR